MELETGDTADYRTIRDGGTGAAGLDADEKTTPGRKLFFRWDEDPVHQAGSGNGCMPRHHRLALMQEQRDEPYMDA